MPSFLTYVKPFWVVIHLISLEGDACHETKGLVEVFELELLLDGIASVGLGPASRQEGLQ